jgi:Ca2+/Na+ antiporter
MNLRNIIFIALIITNFFFIYIFGVNFLYGYLFGCFICVYIFWEFKSEYIFIVDLINNVRIEKDDRNFKERFKSFIGMFRGGVK